MKKQIILITGATAGLGRGLAIALAQRGHHVIATGRRQDALDSLQIEAAGGKVDTFRLDVTNAESIANAQKEVERLTGGYGVDVLVNNAGFGILAPFELTTDQEMRSMFETNVFGLAAMTRAFLPQMRERAGRVINVSSVGGRLTLPFFGAYNATKYAVESMSDAMRVELQSFGVKVVLIEPGATNTEFNDVAFNSEALVDGSPDAAHSPYADIISKMSGIRSLVEKTAAKPESVVRGMVHAVEARNPGARYVLPAYNSIGIFFKTILPTRLWDAILGFATGLRSLGAKKTRSAPALTT